MYLIFNGLRRFWPATMEWVILQQHNHEQGRARRQASRLVDFIGQILSFIIVSFIPYVTIFPYHPMTSLYFLLTK
jgi:uncharacterized membrane protein